MIYGVHTICINKLGSASDITYLRTYIHIWSSAPVPNRRPVPKGNGGSGCTRDVSRRAQHLNICTALTLVRVSPVFRVQSHSAGDEHLIWNGSCQPWTTLVCLDAGYRGETLTWLSWWIGFGSLATMGFAIKIGREVVHL